MYEFGALCGCLLVCVFGWGGSLLGGFLGDLVSWGVGFGFASGLYVLPMDFALVCFRNDLSGGFLGWFGCWDGIAVFGVGLCLLVVLWWSCACLSVWWWVCGCFSVW